MHRYTTTKHYISQMENAFAYFGECVEKSVVAKFRCMWSLPVYHALIFLQHEVNPGLSRQAEEL